MLIEMKDEDVKKFRALLWKLDIFDEEPFEVTFRDDDKGVSFNVVLEHGNKVKIEYGDSWVMCADWNRGAWEFPADTPNSDGNMTSLFRPDADKYLLFSAVCIIGDIPTSYKLFEFINDLYKN